MMMSSSSNDEGHQNLPAIKIHIHIESQVGTIASEVKDLQVDRVRSFISGTGVRVGILTSLDTAVSAIQTVSEVEVTFKPRTTGQTSATGLIPWTHGPFNVYSAQRLDLFARCVRLSRLLVGFRTHFKSLHFHSFIHSFSWSSGPAAATRTRLGRRDSPTAGPGN